MQPDEPNDGHLAQVIEMTDLVYAGDIQALEDLSLVFSTKRQVRYLQWLLRNTNGS
jgi:hypothetical protein